MERGWGKGLGLVMAIDKKNYKDDKESRDLSKINVKSYLESRNLGDKSSKYIYINILIKLLNFTNLTYLLRKWSDEQHFQFFYKKKIDKYN